MVKQRCPGCVREKVIYTGSVPEYRICYAIAFFSAQLCSKEKLKYWSLFLPRAKKSRNLERRWQACSTFLYDLLENSGNLLFRDVFVSLETYARMPFFQNRQGFLELVSQSREFESPIWVVEALLSKYEEEISFRFHSMYKSVVSAVSRYLDEMTLKFGSVPERESEQYSWAAQHGKDAYYTQICRDLMDKIGTGVYKQNAFLPPEAVLASQYGVCISTVRKAWLCLINGELRKHTMPRAPRLRRKRTCRPCDV